MAILARASREELEAAWSSLESPPAYQWLRRPETGLAMVRARAGGGGAKFNLGEASITRCTLRTADAKTGVAYILGRDRRRAELPANRARRCISTGCATGRRKHQRKPQGRRHASRFLHPSQGRESMTSPTTSPMGLPAC